MLWSGAPIYLAIILMVGLMIHKGPQRATHVSTAAVAGDVLRLNAGLPTEERPNQIIVLLPLAFVSLSVQFDEQAGYYLNKVFIKP